MENYQEKSKRLDFIQKLINQSKSKQSNTIKYDQAYMESIQNQIITTNEMALDAAQMDNDSMAHQDDKNSNMFHKQAMNVSDKQYYDYRKEQGLQNLSNIRGKRNST